MLKYFPDSWLSEAQKQGKQAALEKDAKKAWELEEETRQRQKKQEEEKRARDNGSGTGDQKKRQFDLDLSEDIRRRKEERDQKTRQAVEEMDQAVRAGLRQKAASQNGEPLVGSPQWMAREKAKQTEIKLTAAAQKAGG